MQCLAEFLPVYFVPRRTKDFTGANRRYALWVIDEFSGYDLDLETLNMILDGQRMQLDSKYGKVFEKTDNVPVIMLGNSVPYLYKSESFKSRVLEIHFFSKCEPINSRRLAHTFFMLGVRSHFAYSEEGYSPRSSPSFVDPLRRETRILLSNCFGRAINSVKDVAKYCSDAKLLSDLWLPFSLFGSGPITFATEARCLTKMPSFSSIDEKYINLPGFFFYMLRAAPNPDPGLVLSEADKQCDSTAVPDSVPSKASKEEGEGSLIELP